ncbi:MAG: hypothetical protein Q9167_006046 [Letrouitia subvulpina]
MQSNETPSNASEAWQQAVKNYTQALPLKKQSELKAPTTTEQCLQILSDHRSRKKGYTRVLELFKPLIDPLKRFEGAIDVTVQTHAGIASPIWGPLRLAITSTTLTLLDYSEHFKNLERLIFIIDKVAGSIWRYEDIEILFNSHEGVRNAVGTLYCDVIYLCTHVVRFHAGFFRYAFASFEKEFGPISEAIDLHGAEVERAANAAHMKESKAAREQMSVERQGTCEDNDALSAPFTNFAGLSASAASNSLLVVAIDS